jgi:carbon storage regulator
MLVLSRKAGESMVVGDDIVIKVLNIGYRQIQLGIEAPESIRILRDDAKKKQRDLPGHIHPAILTRNSRKNEL